jgi:tRNA pseudouridine32 synthase / 23S rRNA pseudouridine746 synthase
MRRTQSITANNIAVGTAILAGQPPCTGPAHQPSGSLFHLQKKLLNAASCSGKPPGPPMPQVLYLDGRGEEKQDCVHARVKALCADALIVHRLDMGTSGVLIFARGIESLRRLGRQFETRQVHKRYVAIVRGRLPNPAGEISLPLITDWENRPRQRVDLALGKPATTRYCVLDYDQTLDRSRVSLKPVTGRTHQLRVHLAATGTPIVGDPLYGTSEERLAGLSSNPQPAYLPRLLLHAEQLAITHPFAGTPLLIDDLAPF